jgi:hypothetical protein
MGAILELHARMVPGGLIAVMTAAAVVSHRRRPLASSDSWSCCTLHRPCRRDLGAGLRLDAAELLRAPGAWLLPDGFLQVAVEVFHGRQSRQR